MDLYPLPEPVASAAAAAAATERQRQALAAALAPALQLLLDATAAQGGALDTVTTRARAMASRRTNAQAKQLAAVAGQAGGLGATRTAEQAAQLAMLSAPAAGSASPSVSGQPGLAPPPGPAAAGWYCLRTLASGEVRVVLSAGQPTGAALPEGFFVAGGPFPSEFAARQYCGAWVLAAGPAPPPPAPGPPAAPPAGPLPPAAPPPAPLPPGGCTAPPRPDCLPAPLVAVPASPLGDPEASGPARSVAVWRNTATGAYLALGTAASPGPAYQQLGWIDLRAGYTLWSDPATGQPCWQCPEAAAPAGGDGAGGAGGGGAGWEPPPPPPGVLQWYCARDPDSGELTAVQALSADDLAEGGALDVTGPYPSEEKATAWCFYRALGEGGLGLGDFPPAPPCAVIEGITASAAPGTQEWCDGIDALLEGFRLAGDAVMRWAGAIKDHSALQDLIDRLSSTSKTTRLAQAVADLVLWVLKQILGAAEWAVNTAGKVIECGLSVYRQLFPNCNPAAYVGLSLVKAFVTLAKTAQVGVNAGLWLMAGITVELPAVEQLIDGLMNTVCPRAAPSYAEAAAAYRYGYITQEVRDCISRGEGMSPEAWAPYRMGASQHLTLEQHLEFLRRLGSGRADEYEALRRAGWIDEAEARRRLRLSWRVPTLGEALRRYTAGEWEARWWQRTQAETHQWDNFWGQHGRALRSQGIREKDARAAFAAARPVPGPGQLQQLRELLGPGAGQDRVPFTADDYRQALAAQGHTPWWIDRLATAAEIGVSRARASQGRGWTLTAVLAAYAAGRHDEAWARARLTELGYTTAQQDDALERALEEPWIRAAAAERRRVIRAAGAAALGAYRLGAITTDQLADQLASLKIDRATAEAWAQTIDAQERQRLVQAQLKALASAVRAGKVTPADALTTLAASGIRADRAQELVTAWTAAAHWRSPEPSAAKLLRWVQDGLLPAAVARQRLLNLGWQEPDVLLMLAEAQGQQRLRQGRALAAELKREDGAASAVARLLRQSKAQSRALLARLQQLASPPRLVRWTVKGIITPEQLREALAERGITEPWLSNWVKEAENARIAAAGKGKGKAGAGGAGKPAGAGGSAPAPGGGGPAGPGDGQVPPGP